VSATTSALLTERRPFRSSVHTWKEARLFDRYIRSRNRYKCDLIALLEANITSGPVLELNDGFGSIGRDLLLRQRLFTLHTICQSSHGRQAAERKIKDSPMARRRRIWECKVPPFPFPHDFFELIYSVNALHEWEDPIALLRSAWEHLKEGGWIILNDLRRDSDPFITEYVIREMAADQMAEGRFRLQVFLRALESAYTCEEATELLQASGLGPFFVDAEEPMTFTIRIGKQR
jgi:SAM-dependent methyltransferase